MDKITNFDPDRKKDEFPPVPNVDTPESRWQHLPAPELCSRLLQGQLVPFQSDAPKIAERIAQEFLTLMQQHQLVATRLQGIEYALEAIRQKSTSTNGESISGKVN